MPSEVFSTSIFVAELSDSDGAVVSDALFFVLLLSDGFELEGVTSGLEFAEVVLRFKSAEATCGFEVMSGSVLVLKSGAIFLDSFTGFAIC